MVWLLSGLSVYIPHTGRLQPLMPPAGHSVPETHFSIRLITGTEGTGRGWGKRHITFDLLFLISLDIIPKHVLKLNNTA